MSRENVEVVRRQVDAANRLDVDAFVATCHPDVEWEETMSFFPDAPPAYHGREGVRQWFHRAMTDVFSEWWVERADFRDTADDVVLLDLSFGARGRASRAETRLRVWIVFRFADGLVIKRETYPSEEEALEAAGLRE